METLGARIAQQRRNKKLRQEDLAEALGVSAQAVSKWENDISYPDIMLLPKLSEELDISIDELLTGKAKQDDVAYAPADDKKGFEHRILRILVNSSDGDEIKVNLPLPLIKVFLESGVSVANLGGGIVGDLNIDWSQIITLVENGAIGTLVQVKSKGDNVDIVVE